MKNNSSISRPELEYKDISVIRADYEAGKYRHQYTPSGRAKKGILKDDFIFDENMTVKQNREMVAEHNALVKAERQDHQKRDMELFNQMRRDVVDYLMGTYGFKRPVAEKVESFTYTEKHSFMGDYFSALDEYAELVDDCLTLQSK